MVLSFFGRKPQGDDRNRQSDSAAVTTPGADKGESTTTMDFSHIVGGDAGRALASAAGKIQVQEVAFEDVAAIEEAAILYANANDAGAKLVLEAAIDGAGSQAERVWAMLFDLYRLTGDKANFDSRGVAYAQAYEKSPPVWQASDSAHAPKIAVTAREGAPAINLTGSLTDGARAQFEQLSRIGVKMGKLKIDLSRLRAIEDSGGALLHDMLNMLQQQKVKVQIFGAKQGLSIIEPRLKVGEKEGRLFWLLGLTLVQQTGDQERFEDMAINYAITFEESPPSWDSTVVPPAIETQIALPDAPKIEDTVAPPDDDTDHFVLDGVIGGSQPEATRRLAAYAAKHNGPLVVDATKLQRLEFVSAGSLFNQFAALQGQGKPCTIRHPNEMVAALMRVMGIDQVATIEYKKF